MESAEHVDHCTDRQHRPSDPCEAAPITAHGATTSILTATTPAAAETLADDTGETGIRKAAWVDMAGATLGPAGLAALITHLQTVHAVITRRG